ncbi:MAG: hypothetical protein H7840_03855 [Alphaproteobacteria bacterium]
MIVHFVQTVWGEEFIGKWAAFSLRTQLAAGNIPRLATEHDIVYHLYTDRASLALAWQASAPLRAWAEVQMHAFETTLVDGRTMAAAVEGLPPATFKHEINRLSEFHLIDASLARGGDPVIMLTDSDMLFSVGSFWEAVSLIAAGRKVVGLPGLRLSMERLAWRAESFLATDEELRHGLDPRTLVAALAGGAHPATEGCVVTSDAFTDYPAQILWPVGDEGFVCRAFFIHPLAFVPNPRCRRFDSTIDYDFSLAAWGGPDDIVLPGSAQVMMCKYSAMRHFTYCPTARRFSIGELAHFLLSATNRAHRRLVSMPVRLRLGGSEEEWLRVEAESAAVMDQAYALVDRAVEELPPDTPGLAICRRSHFGPLSEFLSPQRQR